MSANNSVRVKAKAQGTNNTKATVKRAAYTPLVSRVGINEAPALKSVGQYSIGKVLGHGTFGEVKLATHMPTGEQVAVKILEKSKMQEKADIRRVNREIKILKKARHPNIIQLYEVLDTPKNIYLMMENCEGGEMFDFIVAHRHVSEPQACKFFHQIVEGVDVLHQAEITHRDLKPENLLLKSSPGGWLIKIVDFGLSNTHEGGKLLTTACGSPCYAAPEMIAGKHYSGPLADIWSMGIILFALVCGYLPFEDANTNVLYKKILSGDYKPPKWISPEVRDLIGKILETNPSKRITMDEIREHIWYQTIAESEVPKDVVTEEEAESCQRSTIKTLTMQGYDCQAVLDAVASHACNSLTTMYYLTQQKHKTAIAKEKKLEELSYFGGASRGSSQRSQLDQLASKEENKVNESQPGSYGGTPSGSAKVSVPKAVPIQPGVLPTRPEAQIPSNSHGRPGSIQRPSVGIPTSHEGNKMINLNTVQPPTSTTGGHDNDISNNSHNAAEGNVFVPTSDVIPDLTQFTAGGNPIQAINNAHIAIAANRRGPIGASFRASFNANLRASVDGSVNGTNLDEFSVANVIASARMAAGMLPPKQVPLVKLGHEAPSGAIYTDHPSEELRTYDGTGARAKGPKSTSGGGNDKLVAINRKVDGLSSANGGTGAGTERQMNVAALLRENQVKQLQLQQQLQEQLLRKSMNPTGKGTTAVAATTSSNNPNLTPLTLPNPIPGISTTMAIETSKTARANTTATGVAGGVGGVNTGGSKSARGAREPDIVMPALNTVTRKHGLEVEIEDEEPRVVRSLQRSPPSVRAPVSSRNSPLGHRVVSIVTANAPGSGLDHVHLEADEIQEQEETHVRNLDLNGLIMSDDSQALIAVIAPEQGLVPVPRVSVMMGNLERSDSTEGHNDQDNASGLGAGLGIEEGDVFVDEDLNDPIVQAQRAALAAVRKGSPGIGLAMGSSGIGPKVGLADDDDESTVILIEDNSQNMVKKQLREGVAAQGSGLEKGNNVMNSPRMNTNGVVITGGGQGLGTGTRLGPSAMQPPPQQPSSSINDGPSSQITTTATVVPSSTAPTTAIALKPRPPLVSGTSVRQSANTRISFNANSSNVPGNTEEKKGPVIRASFARGGGRAGAGTGVAAAIQPGSATGSNPSSSSHTPSSSHKVSNVAGTVVGMGMGLIKVVTGVARNDNGGNNVSGKSNNSGRIGHGRGDGNSGRIAQGRGDGNSVRSVGPPPVVRPMTGLGQIERNSFRQAPSSSANGQPSQTTQNHGHGPSANVMMPVVGSERPTGPPSIVGAGVLATGIGEQPQPPGKGKPAQNEIRASFSRGRRIVV